MPRNRQSTSPRVIAHRGASADYPENTRSAFDAAVAVGAAGIELDLQLTRDGEAIVYHDSSLEKAGKPRKTVADYNARDLQRLDVGKWFSSQFKAERMLSLSAVLTRYAKKASLLLEIKSDERKQERDHQLAEIVVKEVRKRRLGKHVYILSFSLPVLETVHRLDPKLRCVLNMRKRPRMTQGWLKQHAFLHALSINVRSLTPVFAGKAHGHGFRVMTYTSNNRKQVDLAIASVVDVLMTDRPGWVLGYLESGA